MVVRTIVGVDFSGAGEDNEVGKTWITKGKLDGDSLTIDDCCPTSRTELEKSLISLNGKAVAALDFPFGVPLDFATYWLNEKDKPTENPSNLTMPVLWALAACMEPTAFRTLVDKFSPNNAKEYLRVGDLSEAASCLHRVNPNMVPMTFQGMRMLHRLVDAKKSTPFQIPPFEKPALQSPVLLEVMPGAGLRAFGLPYKGYKSTKSNVARVKARKKREEIFDDLQDKSGFKIPNLKKYRERCLDSDDALDSVVAAIVSALWAMESKFCCPGPEHPTEARWKKYKRKPSPSVMKMTEIEAAKAEGWIYVPQKPKMPVPSLRPNC